MECAFIDFRKIVKDKLSEESEENPLIAVYVDHRYAVVGELAHRLKIPLADILFGHASIDKMDVVVLTFPSYEEAMQVFSLIPKGWKVEGQFVPVQLWYNGKKVEEDL